MVAGLVCCLSLRSARCMENLLHTICISADVLYVRILAREPGDN